MTISDWELWACARQQIVQHGDDAVIHASMRSDRLLADGDLDGHHIWLAIVDRIRGLGVVTNHETEH
jgi:hypothetical protein